MKQGILFSLLVIGAICSCTRPEPDPLDNGNDSLMGSDIKIVNALAHSESSTVYVKTVPGAPAPVAPEDAVVSRVFSSTPGREELEKRFGLDRWYEVTLPEGTDPEPLAHLLSQDDGIESVEYDIKFSKASDCISYPLTKAGESSSRVFNDPHLGIQWNYINTGNTAIARDIYKGADINVSDVWAKLIAGDPSIVVAVIDEGVKYNHPDLAPNMWTNTAEANGSAGVDDDGNGYVDDIYGFNFVSNKAAISWTEYKDSGHGTHCAGVISAVNNNGVGVSGIAGGTGNGDGVKIMSCQIFSGVNSASASATAKAFKYAADNGASVASCSFGFKGGTYKSDNEYIKGNGGRNAIEADAIHYFEACKNNDVLDGGIVIFASGNDAMDYAEYPGAMHDIISVSAFGPDYLPAYYTNYGPGCNIVAPGGEYLHYGAKGDVPVESMILSTMPSEVNEGKDYGYMQGTSMACPHVAGIAALGLCYAKSLGKTFTVQEFKNMLLASANDFDSRLQGEKKLYGRSIPLYRYAKQMGSGSIDTWNFMMKVEGIPSVIVTTGAEQWINVSQWFGTSSVNLTYLGESDGDKVYVDISDADIQSLGMPSKPYMRYGKLFVHPTKAGSCKLTIRAIAGGTIVGGGDNVGGMEVSQSLSLVARDFKSDNGGWL